MELKIDVLSDLNPLNNTTYRDYVDAKGCLLFTLKNIPEATIIEKRSNKLFINNEKCSLDNINIYQMLVLMLDNIPDLEIDVVDLNENRNFLTEISALFIEDFITVKYVTRRLTHSPILLDNINSLIDSKNNKYTLISSIATDFDRKEIKLDFNENKIYVKSDNLIGKLICEYRANTLNVQFLREFPVSNIQQMIQFDARDYDYYL